MDPMNRQVKFIKLIRLRIWKGYLEASNGHLSAIYFLRHVALSFKVLLRRVLQAVVPETRNPIDGPLYLNPCHSNVFADAEEVGRVFVAFYARRTATFLPPFFIASQAFIPCVGNAGYIPTTQFGEKKKFVKTSRRVKEAEKKSSRQRRWFVDEANRKHRHLKSHFTTNRSSSSWLTSIVLERV